MVALLRGINVGGRGKLPMADLRAVATELGYDDVATYIQSGNLVLSTEARVVDVATDLATAIAASCDVATTVVVRTRHQLARVVATNPFLARDEDPAHVHVVFMDGPAAAGLARLDLARYQPEAAIAMGSDLHLFLPHGVGRSKLSADLSRQKGPAGTQRNWRTVTKLLEMADAAAG